MSTVSDIATQWDNSEETLKKIDEFIKNHLRYDQRFIIIRLVIDKVQDHQGIELVNTLARLNEEFRRNIRVTDFVAQIKELEYLFLIRCPTQENDSAIVRRLSRMVCDNSTGKCIGRTFYTCHNIGDDVTALIERIMH
ncbi:MAG: hypothetical protein ACI4VX_03230 [Succinivibrionaceae bacterium]